MTIKTIIETVPEYFKDNYNGKNSVGMEYYDVPLLKLETFLQSQLSTLLDEIEKENQKLIGRHNARILNQFQLEMKPDIPLVAYDERVALIPAIIKIAEETKEDNLSSLNKYRV